MDFHPMGHYFPPQLQKINNVCQQGTSCQAEKVEGQSEVEEFTSSVEREHNISFLLKDPFER